MDAPGVRHGARVLVFHTTQFLRPLGAGPFTTTVPLRPEEVAVGEGSDGEDTKGSFGRDGLWDSKVTQLFFCFPRQVPEDRTLW